MALRLKAEYVNGTLRLLEPLDLQEGTARNPVHRGAERQQRATAQCPGDRRPGTPVGASGRI